MPSTADPVFGASLGYGHGNGVGPGTILDQERSNAGFKATDLTNIIYGGDKNVQRRRELFAMIENEPVLQKWDKLFLSREDTYKRGLQKVSKYIELQSKHKLTPDEHGICMTAMDEQLPIGLHHAMFIPTLIGQATPEQQERWLKPAQEYRIIGTYAQTELGHGSFVRGLETTAHYDRFKQEFVLHTPSTSAVKCWPGNLGKTVTHCVVMAQLIVGEKEYGMHAFMVQLRDMRTHKSLPGIELNDLGPKLGYGMNDNGLLRFTQVRIPLDNMLARFSRLTPDGTYHRPPHAKLSYGTMIYVRSYMIAQASRELARAATITTRYSAVRRQFDSVWQDDVEEQVLNYQTQQHIVFPLLATAYAFHFTGKYMRDMYYATQDDIAGGNVETLADLHNTSSAFKPLCTTVTADAIETLRRACGGHGYSALAFPSWLLLDYIPSQTYEGENVVMYLQCARSLMKAYNNAVVHKKKPATGILSYMNALSFLEQPAPIHSKADLLNPTTQLIIMRHRAARLISNVNKRLWKISKEQNLKWEQAVEHCKIELVKAAKAHTYHLILDTFLRGTAPYMTNTSGGAGEALKLMVDLFAVSNFEKDLGDFLGDGYLAGKTELIHETVRDLLVAIRPKAVVLVDAFDFSDQYLSSAVGRYNGDCYETLYKWAQLNPFNRDAKSGARVDVPDGIQQYLQPILDRNPYEDPYPNQSELKSKL